MMILLILIALLFSSCTSHIESAMEAPEMNSISVSLEKSEISSSEQCEITIVIIYHRELIPLIPSIEELLKPINLEGYEEKGISLGEYYKKVINIELENLLPGDYILNPINVPLYNEGTITEELQSPFISLKVTSNLIGEGVFLDDFEELSPEKNMQIYFMILIVIIIIAAFVWAFVYHRKKEEPLSQTGEIFRKKIESLPEECESRDFYSSLTELLREYLDRTVFLSVQSQTTEEFIAQANTSTIINDELKRRLHSYFQRSDETTFGGVDRDISERENDVRFCLDLIDHIEEGIQKESAL